MHVLVNGGKTLGNRINDMAKSLFVPDSLIIERAVNSISRL